MFTPWIGFVGFPLYVMLCSLLPVRFGVFVTFHLVCSLTTAHLHAAPVGVARDHELAWLQRLPHVATTSTFVRARGRCMGKPAALVWAHGAPRVTSPTRELVTWGGTGPIPLATFMC